MKILQILQQLSDEDILAQFLQRLSILIWIVALAQFFLMELAPFQWMNALTMHGKLGNLIQNADKIDFLMIPKSFFMYFYLVGFILSISLATFLAKAYSIASTFQTFSAVLLFSLHCWRRYLESLYITIYGDSKIHVIYWLGGMIHYVFVNISFWAAALEERQRAVKLSDSKTIIFAILLYLFSSWLQYQSHTILYHLKLSMTKKNESEMHTIAHRYQLPKGGGFDFCVCPHYLAEIGIYLSFAILTNWSAGTWLLFVWVICNLSYTASQHYSYYLNNCFEELEKRRVAILFPFIW